ncbi:MAG TPA: NYN domain-containing protein [Gaiellaceae bacterium]|nr:NYN domain-containing protein [Gaiellaceae bacterium]
MAEPTLYLFDGYNLLHAGAFGDRNELVDTLASFVAGRGARGVVVFDGVGEERTIGPLGIRFTAHADDLLERLAADNRTTERVCVVSSDHAVRWTSGQEVMKLASREFLAELAPVEHTEREQTGAGGRVGDRLDDETRERLERLRRGQT